MPAALPCPALPPYLLHKAQFLPLLLIQPHSHHILLFQPLQSKDQEFGIMLIIEGREGDAAVLAALKPMDCCGVDSNSFLRGHIWTIFQVVVLPLLLSFQIQASQPTKVFTTHSLVNSGSSPDALPNTSHQTTSH